MFAACLGEQFRIAVEAGREVEVVLVEAVQLGYGRRPTQAKNAGRQPFSIVFRGPMSPVLPQGTYRFEHEDQGALEIFIVSIGPNEAGMRYEAVFN